MTKKFADKFNYMPFRINIIPKNICKNKNFHEKILCYTVSVKKQKMKHFGFVFVQTRTVPIHNIFLV